MIISLYCKTVFNLHFFFSNFFTFLFSQTVLQYRDIIITITLLFYYYWYQYLEVNIDYSVVFKNVFDKIIDKFSRDVMYKIIHEILPINILMFKYNISNP
jgi:hypothetical protein